MAFTAFQQASFDRISRAHLIRSTFAQSPLFSDAAVSEPIRTPEGDVALTVSFDGAPPVFGVVAGCEEDAYAVLHELALTMVEVDQSQRAAHSRANSGPLRVGTWLVCL
jgi:hypothetical protein